MRGLGEILSAMRLLAMALAPVTVLAAPITYTTNAMAMGGILFDNPVIVVNNVTVSGTADYGTFIDSDPTPVFYAGGVFLTSGTSACIPGPNDLDSCTDGIQAIESRLDYSISAATAVDLTFNFKFASEEFFEYAIPAFSDRFELWLDGDNVAKLPNDDLIDVGTILASGLYVSHLGGTSTQFDAYSLPLSVTLRLGAGQHTVGFRVADVGGYQYDTAVFIAGAVDAPPGEVPEPATSLLVGAGLLLVILNTRAVRHR